MTLCIIMCMGSIALGALVYYIGLFASKILSKDVKTKCDDLVAWWTPEAKQDVDLFIREHKGAQIKKRILIETFKKNVNNPKFADVMARTKALMPPDAILGNLAYVTLPIAA